MKRERRTPRIAGALVLAFAACHSGGGIELQDPILPPEGPFAFDFSVRADILQTSEPSMMVAIGRMSQDTLVDAVLASRTAGTVSIALGRPDGSFVTQTFSLGTRVEHAAIGDFDGDDRRDVALACASSAVLGPQLQGAPGAPRAADEDGHRFEIVLLRQVAEDTFELAAERFTLPSTAAALAALPGTEGHGLVVALAEELRTLHLAFEQHAWSERAGWVHAGRPIDIAPWLAGAGTTSSELVAAEEGLDSRSADSVVAHREGSTDTLVAHAARPGLGRANDLDGDGRADLTVFERAGDHVLLVSSRDGRVLEALTAPGPIGDALVADLDGDGYAELILTQPQQSRVGIARGSASGREPLRWIETPLRPEGLAVAAREPGRPLDVLWTHARGLGRVRLEPSGS